MATAPANLPDTAPQQLAPITLIAGPDGEVTLPSPASARYRFEMQRAGEPWQRGAMTDPDSEFHRQHLQDLLRQFAPDGTATWRDGVIHLRHAHLPSVDLRFTPVPDSRELAPGSVVDWAARFAVAESRLQGPEWDEWPGGTLSAEAATDCVDGFPLLPPTVDDQGVIKIYSATTGAVLRLSPA